MEEHRFGLTHEIESDMIGLMWKDQLSKVNNK